MLFRFKAIIGLCLCLMAAPAQADDFDSALKKWLADDNASSLPEMAKLAQDGDVNARLFLGQIEPLTYLHSDVTSGMERKARIALLRFPKGLSGKSWLTQIDSDLARALMLVRRGREADGASLKLLFDNAHFAPLLTNFKTRVHLRLDLPDWTIHPDFLPYSAPFLLYFEPFLGIGVAKGDEGNLTEKTVRKALKNLDQSMRLIALSGDPASQPFRTAPAELLTTSPQTKGIYQACEKLCPDAPVDCTRTLTLALSHLGILPYQPTFSPSPTLVSTEDYRASRRYPTDLLRRFANSRNPRAVDTFQENACLRRKFE